MSKRLVILAVALTLLLAGCSGGEDEEGSNGLATLETTPQDAGDVTSGTSSSEGDAEQALISFARCMRENGISNFPDVTLNADGTIGFGALLGQLEAAGIDPQSDEFAAAADACAEILQGIALGLIGEGFDQTELQDSLLAFSRCMREQGIDVADPDLTDFGSGAAEGEGPLSNVDLDDPDVRAALEICQREFAFPGISGIAPSGTGSSN